MKARFIHIVITAVIIFIIPAMISNYLDLERSVKSWMISFCVMLIPIAIIVGIIHLFIIVVSYIIEGKVSPDEYCEEQNHTIY